MTVAVESTRSASEAAAAWWTELIHTTLSWPYRIIMRVEPDSVTVASGRGAPIKIISRHA